MARVLTDESTLTGRTRALQKESGVLANLWKIEASISVLLLIVGLILFLTKDASAVLVLGAVVAFLCVGHYIKIRENERDQKSVAGGIRGESKVSGVLQKRLGNDTYILNDVNVKYGVKTAQIDHLVVSPKGLFVLETKNWKGEISGDEKSAKWHQVKREGDEVVTVDLSSPIRQNERHLEVFNRYIKGAGIDWPDVFSIIVMGSPRASWDITNRKTPVLRPHEAADYILKMKAPRAYSESEIDRVLKLFVEGV